MKIRICLFYLFIPFIVLSQEAPNSKFGKISVEDLQRSSYPIDTGANAVIIFDIGETKIIGNDKGWFSLEFRRKTRIHILKKTAYDLASVGIPVYTSGELEEKISDLKASTFNLENGKVVETKLEKDAVFKEKRNKNLVYKKFTFPAVKEGSIIEYEYKLTSDFLFNLQPWSFQSDIPHLWSECKVTLPQFLNYILISQGDQIYSIRDQKDKSGSFSVKIPRDGLYTSVEEERMNIGCSVTEFKWVIKDVPALKEEVYTSTVNNYVKRLDFQLSEYKEPIIPEKIMTTWPALAQKLLKREDFGLQLEDTYSWLVPVVMPLLQNLSTNTEKAKTIFNYMRDNFTCTDHEQLYTDQSLLKLFKNKNGTVAEINLLLTAMLRVAGISADPVILSTKENGWIYPNYPIIGKFNYVICLARPDGNDVFLDATYPELGFGKLSEDCYNGQARVINETGSEVYLKPDQLTEQKIVNIRLINDNKGKWTGGVEQLNGYYSSAEIRKQIKIGGADNFFKNLAKKYTNEVMVSNGIMDSLNNYEQPLKLHYDISFNTPPADIIYFDPILTEGYKQNPFKSAERKYPVEMPYKVNEQYVLNMDVPEGYKIEEMPKSVILKMNDNDDAVFEYRIAQSGDFITLRCKLEINKTKFEPYQYNDLREFFSKVVAKQGEQIVFKKK